MEASFMWSVGFPRTHAAPPRLPPPSTFVSIAEPSVDVTRARFSCKQCVSAARCISSTGDLPYALDLDHGRDTNAEINRRAYLLPSAFYLSSPIFRYSVSPIVYRLLDT